MKALPKHYPLLLVLFLLSINLTIAADRSELNRNFPIMPVPEVENFEETLNALFTLLGEGYENLIERLNTLENQQAIDAAYADYLDDLRILLNVLPENNNPITVNTPHPHGYTLVHLAAENGDAGVINLLLNYGANPYLR